MRYTRKHTHTHTWNNIIFSISNVIFHIHNVYVSIMSYLLFRIFGEEIEETEEMQTMHTMFLKFLAHSQPTSSISALSCMQLLSSRDACHLFYSTFRHIFFSFYFLPFSCSSSSFSFPLRSFYSFESLCVCFPRCSHLNRLKWMKFDFKKRIKQMKIIIIHNNLPGNR